MAITLKLYHGSTEKIDLQDTTAPYIHVGEGWIPAVATPTGDGSIPPYVTEQVPVWIGASSEDTMATELQKIAEVQRLAREYWVDPQQPDPVWLYRKLDGETGTVRSLVKRIDFVPSESWLYPPERLTARTFPTDSSPDGMVTVYDYTAAGGGGDPAAHDIVGDVGARIEEFLFLVGDSNPIGRTWIGLRSANRHGTLANFEPVWELEAGANADASVTDDGGGSEPNTASPGGGSGDFVILDADSDAMWDDGDFHKVLTIELSDTTANESDNYGLMLWLLRLKATDDDVYEVRLHYGYDTMADATFVVGRTIEFSNSSWDLVEMDVMPVPLRNQQEQTTSILADSFDGDYAIQIWARRTTDSNGDLYLDCLLPIPTDEGFFYSEKWSNTSDYFAVYTSPQDTISANTHSATSMAELPVAHAQGWCLPPGDGRMIIAYADDGSSLLAAAPASISLYGGDDAGTYYERWTALRGSE